jgi:predicted RNA-binding protein with PIN domain
MRWIVDGMNVIGSRPDGWWRNRRLAISTLIQHLERWASTEGEDVTVVFEHPLSPPVESAVITIATAARAAVNSADDQIVAMVQAAESPRHIQVATSDRGLSERVSALGASVYPAQRLRDLIDPR